MTENIHLSEEEKRIVAQVAKDKGISFDEAAQVVFERGLEKLLGEISPSTMAIKGILRASKGTQQ